MAKSSTSFKKGNKINLGRTNDKSPLWKGGLFRNKEYVKEYNKKYREKNNNMSVKNYQYKMRVAALEILGNKCCKCGFTDTRALQIDHINGGGVKDRKNTTGNFSKKVIESFLNKENKYQLLCANCNWIKRFENKEIRKKILLKNN